MRTHAIAGGLYLSRMAVAEGARRRGVARALLSAADECVRQRGEDVVYLHVEPDNVAAVGLYESCGYRKKPDLPPYAGFTRSLNLQSRADMYSKDLGTYSRWLETR